MEKFNLEIQRKNLCSEIGYSFLLSRSFSAAEQANGLTTSALAYLNSAIKCILVGLSSPANQLLRRAQEWLQYAIEKDEKPTRYFQHATEASRYYALSILSWLIDNRNDVDSLKKCTEKRDLYLSNISKWDKTAISIVLPEYYDAGCYHRAVEIFNRTPGLQIPAGIKSINSEGPMIYILCRQKIESVFEDSALEAGVQSFLNRNMNIWLVNGHFDVAAKWMKIIYWRNGSAGIDSLSAMLKCLSHLPPK